MSARLGRPRPLGPPFKGCKAKQQRYISRGSLGPQGRRILRGEGWGWGHGMGRHGRWEEMEER